MGGGLCHARMDSLTEYARGLKYSVDFADFPEPNKNGQTDFPSYRITLREGLSPAQTVKTMAHELAHILLNHVGCRSIAELEAESTAFVVCDALGIDSGRTHSRTLPTGPPTTTTGSTA